MINNWILKNSRSLGIIAGSKSVTQISTIKHKRSEAIKIVKFTSCWNQLRWHDCDPSAIWIGLFESCTHWAIEKLITRRRSKGTLYKALCRFSPQSSSRYETTHSMSPVNSGSIYYRRASSADAMARSRDPFHHSARPVLGWPYAGLDDAIVRRACFAACDFMRPP